METTLSLSATKTNYMSDPATLKRGPRAFPMILLAGLTAGTLDIVAACTQYYIKTGKGPGGVLRYIASAVFGKEAFAGGMTMAAWGLLFHYIIAFLFTLFFFWIYPKLNLGKWNKVVTGLVYGIFVWLVMNLVVVRLVMGPHPIVLKNAAIAMAILMVCIGLPISLIIGSYYSKRNK